MSGNPLLQFVNVTVVQRGDCNGELLSGWPVGNNRGMSESKYFYLKQKFVQFLTEFLQLRFSNGI